MPPPATVGVLIVTYDSAAEIGPCVDAVLAQDEELDIVVLDNASRDATPELLDSYGDRIRTIRSEQNTGYAEGVNTAFAASSSEYVLLLNPDVVMDPGCVTSLLEHLRADERAGAAAALLRDPDGGDQHFARREVDLATVAWTFTGVGRRLDARRGGPALAHREYRQEWARGLDAPLPVDCPAAACVLARRSLLAPEPFSEELPLFFNDAELWRRLRAAGWSLDVVPEAGAVHGYATSVRAIDRARMRAEWVASTRQYLRPVLGPAGRGAVYALLLADALAVALLARLGRAHEEPYDEWRGTLGGLGLPGGAKPWLSRVGARAD